jgi:hypothetical protein
MRQRRSFAARAGLFLLIILSLWAKESSAQNCSDFPDAGTLNGIVNTYYTGRGTISAGATQLRVYSNSTTYPIRGSSDRIAAGDMLLVIQMQDADIDSTNSTIYGDGVASDPANGQTALNSAGYFEYVVAQSAPTTTAPTGWITISGAGNNNGLLYAYRTAAGGTPRRLFQVVRVPRYKTATLSSSLSALAWDGTNGGILAIDITGTLTLGGTVSVDGLGFRGGGGRALSGGAGLSTDYRTAAAVNNNGAKGEGIVGTPRWIFNGTGNVDTGVDGYPNGSQARGGPGNAGGGGTDGNPSANDQNTGGGGGGNGGQGGRGGHSWSSNLDSGGHPGAVFPYAIGANPRIAMGGGGGAGTRNNSAWFQSAGGLGGGIVLIRATTVTGTGTVTANGRGRDITGITPDNDGAGGGGAGGTVVVVTRNGDLSGLKVQAMGGGGIDAWPSSDGTVYPGNRHGPGGGGGGGVILLSSGAAGTNVFGGVNGTTTLALDPFGATSGSLGVVQSTVTMNDMPGIQSCNSFIPTRATVRGLRVNPAGLVEFATGSQQGTVGFYIWNTWDPSGRNGLKLLTEKPVTSLPNGSIGPLIYRVQTPPITAPFLLIEEVESGGVHRKIGPFSISDEHLAQEFNGVEKRLADGDLPKANREQTKENALRVSRISHSGEATVSGAIKIEVSDAGTVRLSIGDLISMGLPTGSFGKPNKLRLTNLGQSVPFEIVSGSAGPEAIQFTSEILSTEYTDRNAYVFSWQSGIPSKISVELTRSGFPEQPGMFRIEQNLFYAPFVAQGADPWIWGLLTTSLPSDPFTFDIPNLVADGADTTSVRIGLAGGSNHSHTVRAWINGQAVGTVSFQGKSLGEIVGQVPAGTIRKDGNELTLNYTADLSGPDDVGLVSLDIVDLGVRVNNPAKMVSVLDLVPYDASLPNLRNLDYLIITHELFSEGAAKIADQKNREGYHALVIDVARAYDRYSGGVVEAKAIQRLIQDAWRTGSKSLKYVLLVGNDTFDPKNYLGLGLVSFIPSLNGWDGVFGRVPSENLYADTNGDGAPEVAIGRLPVSTLEEMSVIVDKIERQDALLAAGRGRQLIAVDNQGPDDPSFRQWADEMATILSPKAGLVWADVGLGASLARATLLDGLRNGVEAVHYFGHGGYEIWTDDGLLTAGDAGGLAYSGVGAVVFTWTCEAQWYQYPLGPSINTALFLVPDGGALATFGPAGIADSEPQRLFSSQVYTQLNHGLTLGEAIQRAKAAIIKGGDSLRPVVDGWNLLGDPALRLNWGSQR